MQKPDENLDIVTPVPEVDPLPPGEARDGEGPTPNNNTFLSWLRRSIAVGSVLAFIILVFLSVLSVLFIAIDSPPPPRSDVALSEPPADELAQADEIEEEEAEEPLSFDSFYMSGREPATPLRSNARRRRSRAPRIFVKGYRSRRPMRRMQRPLVPLFLPTTLVIYVENGMIKTRIEPWIQK